MNIAYRPIGFFRTPFTEIDGMPIQPVGGKGIEGSIDILPEFREGLQDLDGFSHVYVLCHLHQIKGYQLKVTPFLDTEEHGIFATRSPKRPNPIGLSIMKLVNVTTSSIIVQWVDVLDQTPVLDIKPYITRFDQCAADRFGWFAGTEEDVERHRSDSRFANQPEEKFSK